jgi:hypothetical protein
MALELNNQWTYQFQEEHNNKIIIDLNSNLE